MRDYECLKYTVLSLSSLVKSVRKVNTNQFSDYLVIPFVKILLTQNDPDMLSHSLSAISNLMDDRQAVNIIGSGILARISSICDLESICIIEPVAKILAYISSGEDNNLNAICDNNFIEKMYTWLQRDMYPTSIKANVLWCLSNISISTEKYINQALPSETHFKLII